MIFTALQEEVLMKKVLDTYSSKNDINIKQIVAYKDNVLEIEEYKDGFKKEDTMNVMSVTKSVTSLLIGIAVDQGLINSVDDFVMDYYKEIYTPKRGEKTIYNVTIKHLLTMTAPYKGKSEPWTKVCTSEDWALTTLDVLGGRKGITNEFRYHTLGVQILLGIIRITSGMNVLDFANEYLFKPLGIVPRSNAGCESKEDQFEYLMNKNDHGKVWFLDPTGMPKRIACKDNKAYTVVTKFIDKSRYGKLCSFKPVWRIILGQHGIRDIENYHDFSSLCLMLL